MSATARHPGEANTTIALILPSQLVNKLAGLSAVLAIRIEKIGNLVPREFERCRHD